MDKDEGSQGPPRIREIYIEARLKPPGPEREAYLEKACAGNEVLRLEVERLLASGEETAHYLKGNLQPCPPTKPEALIGKVMGRYRVMEHLGSGGFGEVYRVRQSEPVRRDLAMKILKLGMDSTEILARFEVERQALAMMSHPGIATIHDAGITESGRSYFVMELVCGKPITEYCDEHHLTIPDRLVLFRQVCGAVAHAHQKGIIHRDLKPSNIVVVEDELTGNPLPKIIDFGIAKSLHGRLSEKPLVTRKETTLGTPAYMSPEQLRHDFANIDTRTDIYSLGMILYELLTGLPPYDMESLNQAGMDKIRRVLCAQDPCKPSTRLMTMEDISRSIVASRSTELPLLVRSLRGDLDWIIMKAIEKDYRLRYQTVGELSDDIQRHLDHVPVQARPPSRVYRMLKFGRRHRLGVSATVSFIFALIIGLVTALTGFSQARAERDRALQSELFALVEATKGMIQRNYLYPFVLQDSLKPSENRQNVYMYFESDVSDTLPIDQIAAQLDELSRRVDRDIRNRPLEELEIRKHLADCYLSQGLKPAGWAQIERMIELNLQLYGPDDVHYADSLVDYASALDDYPSLIPYSLTGYTRPPRTPHAQFVKSLDLLREALEIYRKNNIACAEAIQCLSQLNVFTAIPAEEREAMFAERMEMMDQFYGDSADTYGFMCNETSWAMVAWMAGEIEKGLETWDRAQAWFETHLDGPFWSYYRGESFGGLTLALNGREDLGEQVLAKAIRDREGKVMGRYDYEYERCLRFLIRMQKNRGYEDPELLYKLRKLYYERAFDPSLAKVEYTLNIQTPGTYRLFLRWDSNCDLQNVVYARIRYHLDGFGGKIADMYGFVREEAGLYPGEVTEYLADANFSSNPNWQGEAVFESVCSPTDIDTSSNFRENADNQTVGFISREDAVATEWTFPEAGTYILEFRQMNSGAALDAVVLQLSQFEPPEGNGPKRTPQNPDGSYDEVEGRIVLEAENFSFRYSGRITDWVRIPQEHEPVLEYVNHTGPGYLQLLPENEWMDPSGIYRNRARNAEGEGRWEQAMQFYQEAINRDPEFSNWWARARAFERKGMFEESVRDYTLAIESINRPELDWNRFCQGTLRRTDCYLRLGRYREAARDLQNITNSIMPEFPTYFQWNLAWALAYSGQLDEAIQSLQSGDGNSILLQLRADLEIMNQDLAGALKDYQRALKEDPDACDTYLRLAVLHLQGRDKGIFRPLLANLAPPGDAFSGEDLPWLYLSCLGPDTCPDPALLPAIAERVQSETHRVAILRELRPPWTNTPAFCSLGPQDVEKQKLELAGAALYRAGDYKRSADLLQQSLGIQARTWHGYRSRWMFFQAMNAQQLGDHEKARLWYDQAVNLLDRERSGVPIAEDKAWPLGWHELASLERLQLEAAELLK